jgi:hypothetical protein
VRGAVGEAVGDVEERSLRESRPRYCVLPKLREPASVPRLSHATKVRGPPQLPPSLKPPLEGRREQERKGSRRGPLRGQNEFAPEQCELARTHAPDTHSELSSCAGRHFARTLAVALSVFSLSAKPG